MNDQRGDNIQTVYFDFGIHALDVYYVSWISTSNVFITHAIFRVSVFLSSSFGHYLEVPRSVALTMQPLEVSQLFYGNM